MNIPSPFIAVPFGSEMPNGYVEIVREKKPEYYPSHIGIRWAIKVDSPDWVIDPSIINLHNLKSKSLE